MALPWKKILWAPLGGEVRSGNLEYLGLADVQYLDGHAAVVAADLLKDRVEAGVEQAPVLELGVRTGVVRFAPHLLALRQHLRGHNTITLAPPGEYD